MCAMHTFIVCVAPHITRRLYDVCIGFRLKGMRCCGHEDPVPIRMTLFREKDDVSYKEVCLVSHNQKWKVYPGTTNPPHSWPGRTAEERSDSSYRTDLSQHASTEMNYIQMPVEEVS